MTDNRKTMTQVVEDARRILENIEAHQELNNKHFQMYKELIDSSISHHKERMEAVDKRMDAFEKRWEITRNMLIGFLTIFLLSFVSDKVALQSRPTTEEIEKITSEMVTKEELQRAFGSVLNDTYDTFQVLGILDADALTTLRKEAKSNVMEQIDPSYKVRGLTIK